MSHSCSTCGMPLVNKEDFAGGDENAEFCVHCVNVDGSVKSCEEIFNGGVEFFLSQFGGSREEVEKLTRKNMLQQPYWQGKDCSVFQGPVATDEEFAAMMAKL